MKMYKSKEDMLISMRQEIDYLNENFCVFPKIVEEAELQSDDIKSKTEVKVQDQHEPEVLGDQFYSDFIVRIHKDELLDDLSDTEDKNQLEYNLISTQTRRRLMMKKHKRQKRKKLMSSLLEKVLKNRKK